MAVNSLGLYYNKYMDNTFNLPHIDYRKDNTLTDNNMATIYGKFLYNHYNLLWFHILRLFLLTYPLKFHLYNAYIHLLPLNFFKFYILD